MSKAPMNISSLSNWTPMKVKVMFPKLAMTDVDLGSLKDNYLKEENWNQFDSFYAFLEYQEKQIKQALSPIASDS